MCMIEQVRAFYEKEGATLINEQDEFSDFYQTSKEVLNLLDAYTEIDQVAVQREQMLLEVTNFLINNMILVEFPLS